MKFSEILKALLEAILDINIKSVIVKNPEMPKDLYDSKAGVMDIKAEIDSNTIADIEMQVKDQNNIEERSTFYLTSASAESVKSGQDYTTAKKAVEIINQMSMDEKEWEMYISREKAIINYNSGLSRAKLDGIEEGLKQGLKEGIAKGIEQGIEQGLEQGKEQGIKQKNKQIVAQMLKLKLKDETICEIAQITTEELETIKEEIIKDSSENK